MRATMKSSLATFKLARSQTSRRAESSRLVAAGETNRAIAADVGLSERTVHRHCEAIFSKLGIRSRWQVAAALGYGSRNG
jgi:DNA-binding NarL/FixJ family response regulator